MEAIKLKRFCQSCGMPMKKDPGQGGTEANGAKNGDYCSYCYVNGAFTFQGTAKEMQKFCQEKIREQGSSKFMAWLLTRNIPRLERWQ